MNDDMQNNWKDLERQVKQTVRRAVDSREFRRIQQTIQSTVQEVKSAVSQEFRPPVPPPPPGSPYTYTDPVPPGYTSPEAPPSQPGYTSPAAPSRRKKAVVPGSVAGVLLTVFGGLGLGISFLAVLAVGLTALVGWTADLLATGASIGVFLLLMGISGILIGRGNSLRHRTKRYRQYRQAIGDSSFVPVELLASQVGQTSRFVVKDLRRMVKDGLFPDAHLDDEGSCFMLDAETYRYYLESKKKQEQDQAAAAASPKSADELSEALTQGQQMLSQVRAYNDALPGEEISAKLDRLETVSRAIFAYVQENPEKLPAIRRLLQYYLPTTLKMLDTYQTFNQQPVSSRQQEKTKVEIEQALDTINQAFANLLDSLMQEEQMGVSADISVMKSMLEQEGLTGSSPSHSKPPLSHNRSSADRDHSDKQS